MLVVETYAKRDSFSARDLLGPEHLRSLIVALLLLGAAYVAEHFANRYELEYSTRPTSIYVGDLLLDNLPAVDLNFLIIEVALFSIVAGVIYVFSLRPRSILFTLKAIALFIMIRALFISLTHVGIHPSNIYPGDGFFDQIYTYLNFQTGFFFSLSLIFGISVLLAHIHYSIDVLAAPFMAYGIFKIAQYFFPRDYKLIES